MLLVLRALSFSLSLLDSSYHPQLTRVSLVIRKVRIGREAAESLMTYLPSAIRRTNLIPIHTQPTVIHLITVSDNVTLIQKCIVNDCIFGSALLVVHFLLHIP